jgi:hypothetical protein
MALRLRREPATAGFPGYALRPNSGTPRAKVINACAIKAAAL